jgi:hypothetical protein
VTTRPVPRRHWLSYGTDPLPSGAEALDEPCSAFPSWFMRIECDRCGKVLMVNEAHMKRGATAVAAGRGRRSCSPALRAPAAGPFGRSS